ncbi:MAG: cation transporter [Bacteroidetes bacterium]|nr:cation transporter [Bacteroidales bacterium]MBU1008663.1 cation transporter [Bacteroidota bacterium]
MRTVHFLSAVSLLMLLAYNTRVMGQEKPASTETVKIKTSAICEQCKERLEHNMAFEKGVKAVNLDIETKVLTIEFKAGKNSKEKLKKAVTKIGYDADELEADPKAYAKLPTCCKKDAAPH